MTFSIVAQCFCQQDTEKLGISRSGYHSLNAKNLQSPVAEFPPIEANIEEGNDDE